jgi:putative endonuclease
MSYHHHNTGKKGEDMAVNYLLQRNFAILHRNWRWSRYEIDVIAVKDQVIHFIEVKTRRSLAFGYPEEAVSKKKIERMQMSARQFQLQYPQWRQIQYSILSVTLLRNQPPEFFFIEDVYLY